jgi:hypothetical protein
MKWRDYLKDSCTLRLTTAELKINSRTLMTTHLLDIGYNSHYDPSNELSGVSGKIRPRS